VDVAALSSRLNAIYNPLGITWKATAATYSYSGSTQLLEQGSGLLSAYTDAMKAFNGSYAADKGVDGQTAYLFFFDQYGAGSAKNRNADGFMPRSKQLGYLFTRGFDSTDELYAAAAHELGHGMFALKHPFDGSYGMREGSTDNLMDYTAGATHLAKWQWDLMHDPGIVVRVFEKDEEAMKVAVSTLFNKDDLKTYNQFVNKMKELSLFNCLYTYIDNSDKYVSVSTYTAELRSIADLKSRHKYHNGYFENAKTKNEWFGIVEVLPGEEANPHRVVLFSSKNYELTKGAVKGNAFKSAATVFEEFFHAAHYLYLEENGLHDESSFLTQTEVEVEIAQALVYYIVKNDLTENFNFIASYRFDGYEFIRAQGKNEIDEAKAKFIEDIIKEKTLTDELVLKYKPQIEGMVNRKRQSSGYTDMDISKIDWSFPFLKKLIMCTDKELYVKIFKKYGINIP
jgi:hypothetical protein